MWKLRLRKVKWSHMVTWLSRNRNENDQGVGAASFAHFRLYLRVIVVSRGEFTSFILCCFSRAEWECGMGTGAEEADSQAIHAKHLA